MESLRRWLYRPKRGDRSLLAQFFFADDALNMVAAELDSFDGRKDPERCSTLVNQLRHAQDRVLNITSQIMDQLLGDERVARGFRVKFPEDVMQDNLAGQLWFGAECLAAGSSIMNREEESAAMRPLAKALTRSLETVRSLLRDCCHRPRGQALTQYADDILIESLKIFDRLFAEFELCYVSAMVNVKSKEEFELQQLICVLFSETLQRALRINLLTQEQVDAYDPALMFAVPRLAIVSGLLIFPSGPLSIDKPPEQMSDMFRPFRTLLHKIRELLWTLDRRELSAVERLLCTNEDIANIASLDLPTTDSAGDVACQYPDIGEFVNRFYADHAHCKDVYTTQPSSTSEPTITEADYLPDNVEILTPLLDGMRRLSTDPDLTERTQKDAEPIASKTRQNSDSSEITFQPIEHRSRKASRSESTDVSGLRNLSTNGLNMFDPIVINAVPNVENRQLPDESLVTSLTEQVTEIADKLSSIVANDTMETLTDHAQIHSYSTNDVPNLIAAECLQYPTGEYMYPNQRSEQLLNLPSTSHGYLIPNAISQEPAVLASLSRNNSAIFSDEDDVNRMNEAMLNSQLTISENSELMTSSVTFANANLSSLILTNEEFRDRFFGEENPSTDCDDYNNSNKMTEERVKFSVYESDNDASPGDSGVSTENTSLDRSPDTDLCREIREKQHYMQQNRVLEGEKTHEKESNSLENSFSDVNVTTEQSGDVTVNINYQDDSEQLKNEASSSHVRIDNKENDEPNEYTNLDDVIADLRKRYEAEAASAVSPSENIESTTAETENTRLRRKKSKRKKKTTMWSPGKVLLDNRSVQPGPPMVLNLDHHLMQGGSDRGCGDCGPAGAAGGLSDCADDEEIALALQAQELAARHATRAKFRSSEDLIHRLFVCIAGVADQLQTNFAPDLRNILKSVFLINQTPEKPETPEPEPEPEVVLETTPDTSEHHKEQSIEYEASEEQVIQNGSSFDSVYSAEEVYADNSSDSANSEDSNRSKLVRRNTVNVASLSNRIEDHPTTSNREETTITRTKSADNSGMQSSVSTGDLTETYRSSVEPCSGSLDDTVERAPDWIPDIAAPDCMRCSAHFTAFRRRHHCRNCGKVFCASCSSNSIPLPRYGQLKPVRVCEECFRSIAKHCHRNNPTNSPYIAPQHQYRI